MPDFLGLRHKNGEDEHPNHALEIIKALGNMGVHLENLYKLMKDQKEGKKEEDVTLQTYNQTYYAQGYQNNSWYISDSAVTDTAKVIVTLGGITYTVTLTSGENALDLPDGAEYKVTTKSTNPVSALLIRYNDKK